MLYLTRCSRTGGQEGFIGIKKLQVPKNCKFRKIASSKGGSVDLVCGGIYILILIVVKPRKTIKRLSDSEQTKRAHLHKKNVRKENHKGPSVGATIYCTHA